MKGKKVTNTGWGNVAAWYDELLHGEGTYQKEVILPNILRILSPVAGKKILDIACGQGFFSFALAESGAEVAGFDIASELIARAQSAKKNHDTRNVHFTVAPAHKVPIKKGEYDAVIIILALQNIKELSETCTEAARTLKKEGELIIVLNHPAFRIPGVSEWGYDEAKKIQYRRIDRYALPFATKIDMTPGAAKVKQYTISFHRSLQEYTKALMKAGFVITGLEEWHSHKTSQKGPRAKSEDTARKEFPLFLMLRARKG